MSDSDRIYREDPRHNGNSQEIIGRPSTDYRPLLRLPAVEREAALARWLAMGMPEHAFVERWPDFRVRRVASSTQEDHGRSIYVSEQPSRTEPRPGPR